MRKYIKLVSSQVELNDLRMECQTLQHSSESLFAKPIVPEVVHAHTLLQIVIHQPLVNIVIDGIIAQHYLQVLGLFLPAQLLILQLFTVLLWVLALF